MSAHDLGLPPRFEQAMKRRLGTTGIFVEVGGKYWLDEARLQQQQQQQIQKEREAGGAARGIWASRRELTALRMVRMAVGLAAIALALSNILVAQSAYLRSVTVGLFLLWIALTVFQLYHLSRVRCGLGALGPRTAGIERGNDVGN